MSENGGSEMDKDEVAVLAKTLAMPWEIQNHIFSFCDLTTRATLSRLNKEWHARIVPLLWRHLDFPSTFKVEDDGLVEATRKFFVMCDTMIDESPGRFASLASHVQTLDVGRLHGVNIVHEVDGSDYIFFDDYSGGIRCVFDVIAEFTNLESLSIYIKNWWGYTSLETSSKALAHGLTKLKSLKLGGEMSEHVLVGLLNKPEELKDLTLINLITTPGQDNGPDGMAFLTAEICARLRSLETLHLCKLADLDGRLSDDEHGQDGSDDDSEESEREYASGMRWRFPRESELDVLDDWALLLRHTSNTLQELILENRYLCSLDFDYGDGVGIDPGNTHPADYGAYSIRESQRMLFPELKNQEWPQLKKLVLVGMGKIEDVNLAVSHLEPRVHVEQRLAHIGRMGGDATPEQISTPVEFAS